MIEKLREYNVIKKTTKNRKYTSYNVKIDYKKKEYINSSFSSERDAIRSADMTILKNRLPYKTKVLKPITQ